MIIIASYKNKAEPLVESIKKYTPHEKFVVVDSDGVGGYCIKSYLRGIKENPDDEYMFLHDSMLVKDDKWLDRFRDKNASFVAHSIFKIIYDNEVQRKYAQSICPDGEYAVFGPIFYAKMSALKKIIPYMEKHPPADVIELRGWERALGNICYHEGIAINSVYGEFNYDNVTNDRIEGLKKYFLMRS